MKKLIDLKVGDWVYYIPKGWLQVTYCFVHLMHQIIWVGPYTFTIEGMCSDDDKYPSLFTYDPINGTLPPEPEIAWGKVPIGTPVEVWDEWSRKYTKVFIGPTSGETYPFRVLDTALITITIWKHCRLIGEPKKEWLK